MDKNIKLFSIYEEYKLLLTKHMREMFELYHYEDFSLREIAESKNVTHQAVRDTIKKAEKQILKFEEMLKVVKMKKDIVILIDELNKSTNGKNDKEIDEITKKYR
ncbi:MAG: sigma factor-like helix-turn-helix DNA-binding protein [Clostridia bacterium]|nr:sigma factor-like helix-turn-helix DNA-binding protein [Clostridia bacterium]MDD4375404.1 sigma factor-like helix-turn-helix DNA-binding protein [Clostridia bacterium]